MTREEIEKLTSDYLNDNESTMDMERLFEFAIQMTEPSKDTISRREAINAIDALYLDGESAQGFTADANGDCLIGKYKAIELLDDLPPVTPKADRSSIEELVGHCLSKQEIEFLKWFNEEMEEGE